MDTINELAGIIAKLKQQKEDLIREMDELQSESYEIKDKVFGINARVKSLLMRIITRGEMLHGLLGETINHAASHDFESTQQYLDFIDKTRSDIRDYISKIDQAISNLEKCKHDLEYQLLSVNSWVAKAEELLK